MKFICSVAAALLLAPAAVSQPFFFSEPTPLATTRYVAERGDDARLVTNGVLPYLLWTQDGKVRITPVTPERRAGRPVLDGTTADAVWTGSHFVVVAYQPSSSKYVGRRVGADGEALGQPFTVVDGAASQPHLAFDGTRVLLLFGREPLKTILLSRNGLPLAEPDDAPVGMPLVLDASASARNGEFLISATGPQSASIVTLFADGRWTRTDRSLIDHHARQIATAANEHATQITLWTNGDGAIQATTFGLPNAVSDYTLAATGGATNVAVTWDGADYVYAYREGNRIRFRYFNAPGPFATAAASPDSPLDLVAVNGRTYVAYRTEDPGEPLVVRDVRTVGRGDAGAFAAARQELQSVASSATSALFVWFEGKNDLYAGVRTSAGAWHERQISNLDEQAPLAASDGNGFVIVQTTPLQGWTATLLDGQGNILGIAPRVPFQPTGIAWAGDAYVIVGLDAAQRIVASRLALSGIATAPVVIAVPRAGRQVEHPRVAARDGELLVVWMDYAYITCFPPCDAYESDVLGARLTPALQRVDPQSLLLGTERAVSPDAVWDGARYVITWSKFGKIEYRTLRTNNAGSGVSTIAGVAAAETRVTLVPGGVAITSDTGQVVFLRDGAETVATLGTPGVRDAIATAGSRVIYVQPLARDEMPYHGASRLNVRIGDLVPPGPKPSAPQITRADHPAGGIAMIVEWTAPPEPVNGYRVEYRVDDGVWNELDVWFDAHARSLAIRPWRSDPVRYQFRVRAVNDAGFSPYSNAATIRTRKTRAVR
jgi:hypothetical protein